MAIDVGMCAAGIVLFFIGAFAARNAIAAARGLDKIVALADVCFAIPLAVFGALHLCGARFVVSVVPPYAPWRMFWVYFVGGALLAASVSIAARIAVRWSGLLFGIMMFLFVAMIHLPGALGSPHDRLIWTIVFREMSFGGAALVLAGSATIGWREPARSRLIAVGGAFVTAALVVFGAMHFLNPTLLPGVPLKKEMPTWVPARVLVDYATGAALLVAGGSVLLRKHARTAATCVGGWLVLMVLLIYGPVLIAALSAPEIGVRIEGINYFADTLLFAGCILALARATPRSAS